MLREDRYRKRMLLGQDGNSLIMMIAVLALVFCIFKFLNVAYYLSGLSDADYMSTIFKWFILPAEINKIVERPWTIITYMFMHDGVFHMLGNVSVAVGIWIYSPGSCRQ